MVALTPEQQATISGNLAKIEENIAQLKEQQTLAQAGIEQAQQIQTQVTAPARLYGQGIQQQLARAASIRETEQYVTQTQQVQQQIEQALKEQQTTKTWWQAARPVYYYEKQVGEEGSVMVPTVFLGYATSGAEEQALQQQYEIARMKGILGYATTGGLPIQTVQQYFKTGVGPEIVPGVKTIEIPFTPELAKWEGIATGGVAGIGINYNTYNVNTSTYHTPQGYAIVVKPENLAKAVEHYGKGYSPPVLVGGPVWEPTTFTPFAPAVGGLAGPQPTVKIPIIAEQFFAPKDIYKGMGVVEKISMTPEQIAAEIERRRRRESYLGAMAIEATKTSFLPPTGGTSFLPPTGGTSFLPPTGGTSFLPPTGNPEVTSTAPIPSVAEAVREFQKGYVPPPGPTVTPPITTIVTPSAVTPTEWYTEAQQKAFIEKAMRGEPAEWAAKQAEWIKEHPLIEKPPATLATALKELEMWNEQWKTLEQTRALTSGEQLIKESGRILHTTRADILNKADALKAMEEKITTPADYDNYLKEYRELEGMQRTFNYQTKEYKGLTTGIAEEVKEIALPKWMQKIVPIVEVIGPPLEKRWIQMGITKAGIAKITEIVGPPLEKIIKVLKTADKYVAERTTMPIAQWVAKRTGLSEDKIYNILVMTGYIQPFKEIPVGITAAPGAITLFPKPTAEMMAGITVGMAKMPIEKPLTAAALFGIGAAVPIVTAGILPTVAPGAVEAIVPLAKPISYGLGAAYLGIKGYEFLRAPPTYRARGEVLGRGFAELGFLGLGGYVGAGIAPTVRGWIQTRYPKKLIPEEKLVEPAVLAGKERFPKWPREITMQQQIEEFEIGKYSLKTALGEQIFKGLPTEKALMLSGMKPGIHTTATIFGFPKEIVVSPEMFISPSLSPHFLRLQQEYYLYGPKTTTVLPEAFSIAPIKYGKGAAWPTGEKAFKAWVTEMGTKGIAYVHPAKWKPEKEALFAAITKLTRLTEPRFYTTVKGPIFGLPVRVPIGEYYVSTPQFVNYVTAELTRQGIVKPSPADLIRVAKEVAEMQKITFYAPSSSFAPERYPLISYALPSYTSPSVVTPSYAAPSFIPSYEPVSYTAPSIVAPSYMGPPYALPSVAPSYAAPSVVAPFISPPKYPPSLPKYIPSIPKYPPAPPSPPYVPTYPPRIPPPPTIKIGIGVKEVVKIEERRKPGYLVYVRKRGVEVPITGKPLPRPEALWLGAKVTRETARATFFLRPTKEPAVPRGLPKITEAALKKEFRKPIRRGVQIPAKDIFIQPRARRIKTPGEIREISMVGAAVRRGRRERTKRKKSKKLFSL